MTRPRVTRLRVVRASRPHRARGLLAFVAFQVNGLRVDGATVRRTRRGRLALSYPCRLDSRGREHAYVLPVGARLRREVQATVLAEFAREARS